jgi:predicted regulator of Ras-like GTPase activity (Roadblock/LC7/MglB family)
MSFESILQTIVDECGGGVGAALMERDGIPLEQVLASKPVSNVLDEEVSSVGVEFGRILQDIGSASDNLGGGAMREAIISVNNFILLFRVVNEEFFVVVVLSPDGNLGKARYLIRKNLIAIKEEL